MSRLFGSFIMMVAVTLCAACTNSRAPHSSVAQVNGLAFTKKLQAPTEQAAPASANANPAKADAAGAATADAATTNPTTADVAATGGQLTTDDGRPPAVPSTAQQAVDAAPKFKSGTTATAPVVSAASDTTSPVAAPTPGPEVGKPAVPLAHPVSVAPAKGVVADGDTTFVANDGPVEPAAVQVPPKVTADADQARNQECAIPYRRANADWFPGLPFPPAEPRSTDFQAENAYGLTYTDAARDGVMDAALAQAKRRTPKQQGYDRELAVHIEDVNVSTDLSGNGRVLVQFHYDLGRGQNSEVTLEGQMRDRTAKSRSGVALQQVQSGTTGRFAGVLNCVDDNGGCQNSILVLQLLGKTGKVGREVQVVHRWGNAHVTIAEEDQYQSAEITNRPHRALAEYFGNTANNSCLVELAALKSGIRKVPTCEQTELEKLCGDGHPKFPAARVFSLRTWAVVYGRAGFEFAAQDKESKRGGEAVNHLIIKGPLVISQQRPMASDKLLVSSGLGIARADLIANDGSGDLNLQLIFTGKQKPHMRFNITSLTEPVRRSLQGGASGTGIAPSEIK